MIPLYEGNQYRIIWNGYNYFLELKNNTTGNIHACKVEDKNTIDFLLRVANDEFIGMKEKIQG